MEGMKKNLEGMKKNSSEESKIIPSIFGSRVIARIQRKFS
jgi:hypothetical protein